MQIILVAKPNREGSGFNEDHFLNVVRKWSLFGFMSV